MTYEEFEWHILRMAYEDDIDRVRPSMLAYTLGIPIEVANAYLEQAVYSSVLELEIGEQGDLEYFVPGIDRSKPAPKPVWREEPTQANTRDANGFDGSVTGEASAAPQPKRQAPSRGATALPPNLRSHIAERYGPNGTSGSVNPVTALVVHDDRDMLPVRIESNDEAFCDASRTMFMRQIRVYGAHQPQALKDQVARLFQGFGYRKVDESSERLRFERGSVMFLLALVPLFVLVVPLIIYLFMYAMGRSTIHQEPLELDVQFRRSTGAEPYWEIDLTYVALHGVVLGAADQQQLNREIDTLRDELQWALTAP
jgi:hypothetical protein